METEYEEPKKSPIELLRHVVALHKQGLLDDDALDQAALHYLASKDEPVNIVLRLIEEERRWRKEAFSHMNMNFSHLLYVSQLEGKHTPARKDMIKVAVDKAKAFYKHWEARFTTTIKINGLK